MPPPETRPLTGLGVLVTRPSPQADRQVGLIRAAGGRALLLPLLAIDAADDPAAASVALMQPAALSIFTSVNAVTAAARLLPPPWPGLCAATGTATAAALRQQGVDPVLEPLRDGAAGLLELPQLRALRGRRVRLVCGQNPLPDLARGLRVRGAELIVAEVYRRRRLPHPPQRLRELLADAQAAIVTSGEALEHLLNLTPGDARPHLLALQLALPSPRIAAQARTAGFTRSPLVPHRVNDPALVEALVSWWREHV
ncbi:MAG: uroporphyrinogen-III synthase [Gammaproteobacteria bacterium]|nr:uroporphyrinogen-III synthase [Gammaproteobacteria bacterium]